MGKEKKVVTVELKALKLNLFVRKALNQDHVLYLAELLENGVDLGPLKITPNNEIVDGRHRFEALQFLNRTDAQAEIIDVRDEADIIAVAYKANVGGSLPPTQEDTEHTIMLLIGQGLNRKRIGEVLGLPAGMARRYVGDVQSKMARAQLQKAKEAVVDGGLSVAKAAETHGVEVDKLKTFMGGGRRKSKANGVSEMQRKLTRTYKSTSSTNAALLRSLLEKLEDGDVSRAQVTAIFEHVENLQKQSSRAVADWRGRFEAMPK